MASAPPGAGAAGGEEPVPGPAPAPAPGPPPPAPFSSRRWGSEIRVYTRKYPRKSPKPPPPPPKPSPNRSPLPETLSSILHSVRHPEDGVAAGTGPTASTSILSPPVPAAVAPPSPPSSPPATAALIPPPPPVPAAVAPPSPPSSPPATAAPIPPPPPVPAAMAPPSPPSPPPSAAAPVPPPPPSPIQVASSSPPPPASAPATATAPSHLAPDPAPLGQSTPALPPPGVSILIPASNDISSGPVPNGHGNDQALVTAGEAEKEWKRRERGQVRRQLASELDQVRMLSKRVELVAENLKQEAMLHVADAGYARSQFSPNGPITPIPAHSAGAAPVRSQLQRGPLTVSVVHTQSFKKEKRTPRANQLYQSSEFLLARDKFPPMESHSQGHKKSKHHKKKQHHGPDADRRLYSHAFKKSLTLLNQLMKQKSAWIFNKPVNPVEHGCHDYFSIIKHPMDLGTIRGRLSHGQYSNPKEFAADVRLTFHNAMTYNPEGHAVHVMAEQLLGIFEAKWPEIEAEVDYLASCPPLPKAFPPPPIDLSYLERSGSVKHDIALDSNSRLISHTPNYDARTPSRKPRAKDPNKRDMTIEEKRKLGENLQNLPQDKLNSVLQIMKNKNLSVSQQEDAIEVDIDSMDVETLWEFDRFVANYKKNLSKQKRKAERLMLVRQNAESCAQHAAKKPQPIQVTQEPNVGERPPNQSMKDLMAGKQPTISAPNKNDNNGQNASSSSNSSNSSSDSGSSSSDSDGDTSSSDESEAAKSS